MVIRNTSIQQNLRNKRRHDVISNMLLHMATNIVTVEWSHNDWENHRRFRKVLKWVNHVLIIGAELGKIPISFLWIVTTEGDDDEVGLAGEGSVVAVHFHEGSWCFSGECFSWICKVDHFKITKVLDQRIKNSWPRRMHLISRMRPRSTAISQHRHPLRSFWLRRQFVTLEFDLSWSLNHICASYYAK